MRSIIHDQILHKFIEGPLQTKFANDRNDENTTHRTGLSHGYESEGDVNIDIYERDMPYHSMNDRQD
jgi:hypothetical protein